MGEVLSPPPPAAPQTTQPTVPPARERAARRTLRVQIAHLDSELGAAVLESFAMRGHGEAARPDPRTRAGGMAHLLDLGELEVVRDELAARLGDVRAANAALAARQRARRAELAEMLRQPERYRYRRITCAELGEPGCGAWRVVPRLGPIGMLAGWWQVKLSSGCPLPGRP